MQRIVTVLVVLMVLLAGCGGGGGDSEEPIQASSSPASIDETTLSETGYGLVAETSSTRNVSFTITIQGDVQANPTFEVNATTRRTVYRRSLDAGPATVGLLSVPTVKPSEQLASRLNPFRDRTLAERVENATGATATELRHRENRTVTMLGNETTMRMFEGTVTRESGDGDAVIGVATVRDGVDDVTVVIVYPRSAEEPPIDRLLAGIEH